jgi:hypothetical protein
MNKPKVIPFHLLYKDSLFTIHSEPSRNIARSTDSRTYRKVCDAYSVLVTAEGKDAEPEYPIILRPHDLVLPASRPTGGNRNKSSAHKRPN